MLMVSISVGSAAATPQAIDPRVILSYKRARSSAVTVLESQMRAMYRLGSSTTAAATTGPARQPRPTSSTPATRLNPSRRIVFSTVLKARTLTTGRWPDESHGLLLRRVFHPRGFSLQFAQEIELRATHPGRPHDVDLVDDRRMQRKDPLDSLAERNLAHGKCRACAATV